METVQQILNKLDSVVAQQNEYITRIHDDFSSTNKEEYQSLITYYLDKKYEAETALIEKGPFPRYDVNKCFEKIGTIIENCYVIQTAFFDKYEKV